MILRGVQRPDRHGRGSILIMVLWSLSLLSLLVAGLGTRGAFALGTVDRLDQELYASYLTLGAIQHALGVLARDSSPAADGLNEEWADSPGVFAHQPLGRGQFSISHEGQELGVPTERYGLVDEERKLNLNTAPGDVLRSFFEGVGGLNEDEARQVADAIQDWRDEDKRPRPDGVEDFYYLGLPHAYESKDGPFENVEELRLVKDISPELFARVAPSVTVHGSGAVNLNTAEPAVLRALGLSEAGVDGLVFYRVGEDNSAGTGDDHVLASVASLGSELARALPAEDLNRLTQLATMNLVTVKSEAFRLSIVAWAQEGKTPRHLECVVNRSGELQAWTEW